jgi:hypothetical protein
MKLQEFVSETLKEIIAGVKEAQGYAGDHSAKISVCAQSHLGYLPIEKVRFDVAVTSTDASETQAGAGVFVAVLGIGAKGKSDTSNSCVSRIKFSIPIVLPEQQEKPV